MQILDNTPPLQTIDLDDVTGAFNWGKVVKWIPGVGTVLGGVDAVQGYNEHRKSGHNVPESVAYGAVQWLKSATYYDVWGSTPAY